MSPNNKYVAPTCPSCNVLMVQRNGKFGKFWGCRNYPECKSIVGAHQKNGAPLGIPADQETRQLRMKAHDLFDRLWKNEPTMEERKAKRKESYQWMQDALDLTEENAHIAMMMKPELEKLIFILEKENV